MSPSHPEEAGDILPEYDFTHAVRGKHHESYCAGTNVVFLAQSCCGLQGLGLGQPRASLLLKLAKDPLDQVGPSKQEFGPR